MKHFQLQRRFPRQSKLNQDQAPVTSSCYKVRHGDQNKKEIGLHSCNLPSEVSDTAANRRPKFLCKRRLPVRVRRQFSRRYKSRPLRRRSRYKGLDKMASPQVLIAVMQVYEPNNDTHQALKENLLGLFNATADKDLTIEQKLNDARTLCPPGVLFSIEALEGQNIIHRAIRDILVSLEVP